MIETLVDFPFPYTLRRSRRAKSLLIKLSRESGVEVVYPYWSSKKEALNFLCSRQDWLIKNRALFELAKFTLPQEIDLKALQCAVMLTYEFSSARRTALKVVDEYELKYSGPDDVESIHAALSNWVHEKAEVFLSERLAVWSSKTGLTYSGVGFRRQKTLWGSCNSNRSISLNYRLAFLPQDLVDYVLLHELCHTMHMNHSFAFWDLLREFMPGYSLREKELKKGLKYIPSWYLSF